MVKSIRFKDSDIKLRPLKSRRDDFVRINPLCISKIGRNKMKRKGLLRKNQSIPTENPYHFVSTSLITNWSPTRFHDNNIHFGLTVSISAVSKLAVKRNLVRRRLKSIINSTIREYNILGYDFVFTARRDILNVPYKDLKHEFRKAMRFVCRSIKNNTNTKDNTTPNNDFSVPD